MSRMTSDIDSMSELIQFGIRARFADLPEGLDTGVRERGSRLSAGERQLVSLARASLLDPAVLVLDEAMSNLDPGTEAVVEQAMEHLMAGRTTIVIAHRLTTASRADRIAVVADGGIAELGTTPNCWPSTVVTLGSTTLGLVLNPCKSRCSDPALADAPCEPEDVEIVTLSEGPGYDGHRFVAEPIIEGSQSNVRIIRLSPGQALPPHRHGSSDLMLFAVEGDGVLETDDRTVAFTAGSLAYFRGEEELRVSNKGLVGLTMLAFLAPPFPPRPEP